MSCQAQTKAGRRCQKDPRSGSRFCWLHQQSNETKNQVRSKIIVYPWASNFVEWLLPELKALNIPYQNRQTDGDYYDLTIGQKKLMLDWKHLRGEIEKFSAALRPYGYKIQENDHEQGYLVEIKRI